MNTYEAVRILPGNNDTCENLLAVDTSEHNSLALLCRLLPQHNMHIESWVAAATHASSLKHVNISNVRDVIESQGRYSMVTEYVNGEDLAYLLTEGNRTNQRMPVSLSCAVVLNVAKALHFAHSQKRPIMHGEVCPANIQVTFDGQVRVANFGMSGVIGDRRQQPEYVRNILPYASIEALSGNTQIPQSDLFSLGTLFHELLTGKQLFGGPNADTIVRNIKERYIPPPSVYNSDVPVRLDTIVLSLLGRTDSEPVLTGQLISQLESFLASQTSAHDQSSLARWMQSSFYTQHKEREELVAVAHSIAAAGTFPQDEIPVAFPHREKHLSHQSYQSQHSSTSLQSAVNVNTGPVPTAANSMLPLKSKRPYKLLGGLGVVVAGLIVLLLMKNSGDAKQELATSEQTQPALTGTQVPSTEAAKTVTPRSETETKTKRHLVALELHVLPTGAEAQIEGEKQVVIVRKSGALLPAPADTAVTLNITKDGYQSKQLEISTPDTGTTPVYINLDPIEAVVATTKSTESSAGTSSRRTRKAATRSLADERRKRNGTLVVSFRPSDATVVVDGIVRQGSSPLRIALPPGPHSVRVSAKDHVTESARIQLDSRKKESVDIRLKAAERPKQVHAEIEVVSNPSGGEITINGEKRGNTPSAVIRVAAEQTFRIEVKKSGYKTWRDTVMSRSSRVVRIRAKLEKISTPTVAAKTPEVKRVTEETTKPKSAITTIEKVAEKPKKVKPVRVRSSEVTKIAGTIPTIQVANAGGTSKTKPIPLTICINTEGSIIGAQMTVTGTLKTVLLRSLKKWRYRPFVKNGVKLPVCFSQTIQLPIKGS